MGRICSTPGRCPADAFKLMNRRRSLLARGFRPRHVATHLRRGLHSARKSCKAHLHMLEEAAKRDHRKLGREMDLFHMQEEAPGQSLLAP